MPTIRIRAAPRTAPVAAAGGVVLRAARRGILALLRSDGLAASGRHQPGRLDRPCGAAAPRRRCSTRTASRCRKLCWPANGRCSMSATAPATSAAARRSTCRGSRASRSTRTWTVSSGCFSSPATAVIVSFSPPNTPISQSRCWAAMPRSQALLRTLPAIDGVSAAAAGRLYLIDPLGNAMLSYSATAPDKALLDGPQKTSAAVPHRLAR